MESAIDIMDALQLNPLVQISNMQIPVILTEMFDLTLDDFRHINIEKFLALDIAWLKKLVYLQSIDELDAILDSVPDNIKIEAGLHVTM